MRQLSPEGVLGLSPTLVLAVEGSGPKETIDVLQRATFLSSPCRTNSPATASLKRFSIIAGDVGAPARGECLAGMVRNDMNALGTIRAQIIRPSKSLSSCRWPTAGR